MPTKKLANKVAVVTGASKGIGAAIAKALAAEGASVVVNYASAQKQAESVVHAIVSAGGKAVAIQADLSKSAEAVRPFEAAVATYGRLDILVNNAGLYQGAMLADITEELFLRHYNLNVWGVIRATQEAVKRMGPEGGAIVNVSSVLSTASLPGNGVYNSSKSAVDGLTRTFAKELAPRKIRVNSVNPGLIETEGLHSTGGMQHSSAVAAITPLGRIGLPSDIAPGVVFLCSEESGWMTGESLFLTGGFR